MNIIAGILGYLAALGVLLGAAIFGVATVLQEPPDTGKTAAKSPALVRAADRKPSDAFRAKPVPAAPAATPAPATATTGQAQANEPQPAQKQAKVAKPKPKKSGPNFKPNVRPTPEFESGTALGFAGPPRAIASPFFR